MGDEVEREVEGADRADDAEGHPQHHPELADAGGRGLHRHGLTGQLAGLDGGEGQRGDGPLGFGPRGLDRLAGLGGNGRRQLVLALGDDSRRAVEDRGALVLGQVAGLEGGARRLRRAIDERRVADRHPPDHGAVVGALDLGPLAGLHPLAGDDQLVVCGLDGVDCHQLGIPVRERLDRDAVVGLTHPELVGRAAADDERLGRLALALDQQLQVGDRAVERVVLGAVRVGVDPADEVLRLGRDVALDDDARAVQDEVAARRCLVDRRRAHPLDAAEPVFHTVEDEAPVGDPRHGGGADLDPGGAGVEVGAARAVGEGGALDPDPALGVLGAPVVADHPRPVGEVDIPAVDGQLAREERVRVGAEELRLRQLRLVHPLPRQEVEGLGVVGEGEVPARAQRLGLDPAVRLAVFQHGVADADVEVPAAGELARRHGDLGRLRRRGAGVEEREPDRGRWPRRRGACGPCGGSRCPGRRSGRQALM